MKTDLVKGFKEKFVYENKGEKTKIKKEHLNI